MSPIIQLFRRKSPLQEKLAEIVKLPHSVLITIPAGTPPPGVKSLSENPETLQPVIIAVCSILFALMLICCGIRTWTKFMIMRPVKLRWNDLTWLLALLTSITCYVITMISVTGLGTVGLHTWDYSLARLFTNYNGVGFIVPTWNTPLAFGLVKLTIWLTYIEIFTSMRWVRVCCYVGAAITSIWYFPVVIATLVWTTPPRGKNFVYSLISDGIFTTQKLTIPIAAVAWQLTFSYLLYHYSQAIVASILSIIYRVRLNEVLDNTWALVPVFILTLAELFIGMIIACTWHMSKFFRTYDRQFGKVGSSIAYIVCFRCARKFKQRKESEKSGKGSEGSETNVELVNKERCKKQPKLYPNLDVTNFNATIVEEDFKSDENIELGNTNGVGNH
ncbi:integral membrane protein [Botrytis cinerea]